MTRPVCVRCTRNARTVDTPRVKVRVETSMVYRSDRGLVLRSRCHGQIETRLVPEQATEDYLELLEVFGD